MTRFGVFFVVLAGLLATIAYVNVRERNAELSSGDQSAQDARMSTGAINVSSSIQDLIVFEVVATNAARLALDPTSEPVRLARECEVGDDPDASVGMSFVLDGPCPQGTVTTGTWRVMYR